MWMNAVLPCIRVITMLNAQTLLGASLAGVVLDMKEMDILVKVYSHSKYFDHTHLYIAPYAVVDAVLIGSIVGSGLVIGVVFVMVAVCICYVLYHSHVAKFKHYR